MFRGLQNKQRLNTARPNWLREALSDDYDVEKWTRIALEGTSHIKNVGGSSAKKRKKVLQISTAVAALLLAAISLFIIFLEAPYRAGTQQIAEGNYSAAIDQLTNVRWQNYRNTEQKIQYSQYMIIYEEASSAYSQQRYYLAYNLFSSLGSFKDAEERAFSCVQPVPTGEIYRRYNEVKSPTLKLSSGENLRWYVLFDIFCTDDIVISTVFLSPGELTELKIPPGEYQIMLRAGTRWFGAHDIFGDNKIHFWLSPAEGVRIFDICERELTIYIMTDPENENDIVWTLRNND